MRDLRVLVRGIGETSDKVEIEGAVTTLRTGVSSLSDWSIERPEVQPARGRISGLPARYPRRAGCPGGVPTTISRRNRLCSGPARLLGPATSAQGALLTVARSGWDRTRWRSPYPQAPRGA